MYVGTRGNGNSSLYRAALVPYWHWVQQPRYINQAEANTLNTDKNNGSNFHSIQQTYQRWSERMTTAWVALQATVADWNKKCFYKTTLEKLLKMMAPPGLQIQLQPPGALTFDLLYPGGGVTQWLYVVTCDCHVRLKLVWQFLTDLAERFLWPITAPCNLGHWPPDPRVDHFMPLPT